MLELSRGSLSNPAKAKRRSQQHDGPKDRHYYPRPVWRRAQPAHNKTKADGYDERPHAPGDP